MKNPVVSLRSLMQVPLLYQSYQNLVWGKEKRAAFIQESIRPQPRDRILDIGCGPGDILEYMPSVTYLGFDMAPAYIAYAQQHYGKQGRFVCERVSRTAVQGEDAFDIVLAMGILHHLSDEEAFALFELTHSLLKPGGRLVTLDGCFDSQQSVFVKALLRWDRGEYVRDKTGYLQLAQQVFPKVTATLRHDVARIPYTHLVMECQVS